MSNEAVEQNSAAVHRHDLARIIRLLVIAALVIGLVVVAMDNRDDVRVGYSVGDASAPVWIVIVAAAASGLVIGWLIRHRPHRND